MNKTRRFLIYTTIFIFFTIIIQSISLAQGPPDPGCNPDDPLCPIDGGVSLLIAAGIGIGARKLKSKNNTNKL